MHRRLAVVAIAIVVLGCKSGSPRLEGTWKGTKAEGVATEAQAAANAFATQTTLVIKGDQITISFPKETQTGKYRVIKDDKNVLVIVTDKDGPEDKQTFTFVDDRTVKWSVLEGKTITFVKQ